ncbi:hypothetical protein P609_05990 [Comamonas thiooxydans]|nr:hypothetical protein P609_05990 [Comamonas thiooxydans]
MLCTQMVSSGMFPRCETHASWTPLQPPDRRACQLSTWCVAIQTWFSLWLAADQYLVQAGWFAAIPFRASGGWTFRRNMVFLDAFEKQIAHKRVCRGLLH